jgi:hypothetical protein
VVSSENPDAVSTIPLGSDETIHSFSIPAGLMANNGDALVFNLSGTSVSTQVWNWILNLRFGSTGTISVTNAIVPGTNPWGVIGVYVRMSSTTMQAVGNFKNGETADIGTNTGPTGLDYSVANDFKINAQHSSGGDASTDAVHVHNVICEYWPAPA